MEEGNGVGELPLDQALAQAFARAMTLDELFDISCAVLRHHLGDEALISIYTESDGRRWLRAQRGHERTVGSLDGDAGVVSLALEQSEIVVVPRGASQHPRFLSLVESIEGIVAAPFRHATITGVLALESRSEIPAGWADAADTATIAILAGIDRLIRDARSSTARDRLLWPAFARLATMRDAGSVLELAARTVGSALELDCVQIAEYTPDGLVPAHAWVREGGSSLTIEDSVISLIAEHAAGERWRWNASGRKRAQPTIEARLVEHGVRAAIGVPLRTPTGLRGYLVGLSLNAVRPSADQLDEAALLTSHAAAALENLRAFERKEFEASTDALTGLANHRRFHEAGQALIASQAVGGFTLVLADIDDFKELNDSRGHVAGDDALRAAGTLLRRGMRSADSVYRLGGEEFAMLLPVTTKANARTVCRRLQRAFAANDFDGWKLTLSFGVATCPEDGAELRDLMQAADAALYEAKRLGKDRITFADERLIARRSPSMAARTRRSFEQIRLLQDLAGELTGTRAPSEVAESLLRTLRAAIPHEVALVLPAGSAGLEHRPLATTGKAPSDLGAILTAAGLDAVARRQARLLDSPGAEPMSVLSAPLAGENRMVGAVALAASGAGSFDRDDLRLLDLMAHVAGLAFENAMLVERAEADRGRALALLDLGRRLSVCVTADAIGEVVATAVVSQIACDRAVVWEYGADDRSVIGAAGPAADVIRQAVSERVPIDREKIAEQRGERGETTVSREGEHGEIEGVRYAPGSVVADAPIMRRGIRIGKVCALRDRGDFQQDELLLLEGMAVQAALAFDAQEASRAVESALLSTIDALMRALEAQDLSTAGHALAIGDLARDVGRRLGLDPQDLLVLEHAAVLHDIGKIGVPVEILRKPGRLDEREFSLIREHPAIGARILEPVARLRAVAPLVRASHERYDGSGYPDGLAGDQIPLGARIIAVCDAFDAMTSDRPYRKRGTPDDAVRELRLHAGSQFDPAVVEAFCEAAVALERAA